MQMDWKHNSLEKREASPSNYNGRAIADKPVKITMKDWSMIFFSICKYTKSIATRTMCSKIGCPIAPTHKYCLHSTEMYDCNQ